MNFLLIFMLIGQEASAYDRAVESVVRLTIVDTRGRTSFATGVVVGDGDILTAAHVVVGNISASAPLRRDGVVSGDPGDYAGPTPCQLIRVDRAHDMALLRAIKPIARPMNLAARGASPGATVFTIGNGERAPFRFAGGSVRQVYASRPVPGRPGTARQIECGVVNAVGDSGGPVVDRRGELAGIVSYAESGQVVKAIDVGEIRAFLEKR